MEKIYCLTVIGGLDSWFTAFAVVFFFLAIIPFISYIIRVTTEEIGEKQLKLLKKLFIVSTSLLFFFSLCATFTPDRKEMYAIYGIGTVVDYVENNAEAKRIPDNAVKAINHYLGEIEEDKRGSR